MNKKTKPTKENSTTAGLTEERVREIVREEIEHWLRAMAKESQKVLEEMIKSGAYSF